MPVVAGDPITALAVNTANAAASITGTLSGGSRIEDVIGNGGEFWVHRTTGTVIAVTKSGTSMFDVVSITVERYVSGWTTVGTIGLTGSTTSGSVSSSGRGRYRATGYAVGTTASYAIYCGQTDILPDEEVVCFDAFTSSGGKVSGGAITAAMANTTRIGSPKGIV